MTDAVFNLAMYQNHFHEGEVLHRGNNGGLRDGI
jgi:hypothetical protein